MTCNTAIDYGDQDEWTPYVAFPAKEQFFSLPIKLKDTILSRNHSCVSPLNETVSVFKKHLLVTLNLSLPESLCDSYYTNGDTTESSCLRGINSCITSNKKATQIWDNLRGSCRIKSRTKWHDSVESDFFFRALGVEKSTTRDGHVVKDDPLWNLQRCTCKEFRNNAFENKRALNEIIGDEEECNSPCLCPRYFISRSGVVFGSFEEKQCFDAKMDKMEAVFKSELKTIKEQHERLKVI
ncbi:uncharacterized protein LOC114522505 [Dendronephthya gigantea]|uniref:uncharacterized protein LOC114522505 n=1 Tax=Dendronephthya gigantea TaxID=151771 RepID=UPI00106A13FA|nr:uncharacterized protein LOC114522505 [Dendronephthya gigantea]